MGVGLRACLGPMWPRVQSWKTMEAYAKARVVLEELKTEMQAGGEREQTVQICLSFLSWAFGGRRTDTLWVFHKRKTCSSDFWNPPWLRTQWITRSNTLFTWDVLSRLRNICNLRTCWNLCVRLIYQASSPYVSLELSFSAPAAQ